MSTTPDGRDDLIQIRRDVAADWASVDPVLEDGEFGYDKTNKVLKVGDGVSTWSELEPAQSGAFASPTTVPVTDVTGTSDTIAAGDLGKILRYTDAGLVTVTLPDGIAVGSIVHLLFWGAAGGAIQDNGTSVVQPEGTVAQYGEVSCVVVATNTWSVQGNVA